MSYILAHYADMVGACIVRKAQSVQFSARTCV